MGKFVNIRETLDRKKLDAQAKAAEELNRRIEKRLRDDVPELTELEKDVIVNGIGNSDFRDIAGLPDVWSNCIVDTCKITTKDQISGVVSSLVKKNLIEVANPRTSDSSVRFTVRGLRTLEYLT